MTQGIQKTLNEFLEKRGESYFCRFHEQFVTPVMFGIPPEDPENCCPKCLEEEFETIDIAAPNVESATNVVMFPNKVKLCHIGDCVSVSHGECESCGEEFCAKHLTTYSGFSFCDECDPVKGAGVELDEDDESDPLTENGIVAS